MWISETFISYIALTDVRPRLLRRLVRKRRRRIRTPIRGSCPLLSQSPTRSSQQLCRSLFSGGIEQGLARPEAVCKQKRRNGPEWQGGSRPRSILAPRVGGVHAPTPVSCPHSDWRTLASKRRALCPAARPGPPRDAHTAWTPTALALGALRRACFVPGPQEVSAHPEKMSGCQLRARYGSPGTHLSGRSSCKRGCGKEVSAPATPGLATQSRVASGEPPGCNAPPLPLLPRGTVTQRDQTGEQVREVRPRSGQAGPRKQWPLPFIFAMTLEVDILGPLSTDEEWEAQKTYGTRSRSHGS